MKGERSSSRRWKKRTRMNVAELAPWRAILRIPNETRWDRRKGHICGSVGSASHTFHAVRECYTNRTRNSDESTKENKNSHCTDFRAAAQKRKRIVVQILPHRLAFQDPNLSSMNGALANVAVVGATTDGKFRDLEAGTYGKKGKIRCSKFNLYIRLFFMMLPWFFQALHVSFSGIPAVNVNSTFRRSRTSCAAQALNTDESVFGYNKIGSVSRVGRIDHLHPLRCTE